MQLSLDTAFVAVFTVVGWTIFLRRRGDWLALLTSLALVVWGPHNGALVGNGYGLQITGVWSGIGAATVGLIAYGSWMLFLYLFPSGGFVPRCTRFCALGWVLTVVLWAATPVGPLSIPVRLPVDCW